MGANRPVRFRKHRGKAVVRARRSDARRRRLWQTTRTLDPQRLPRGGQRMRRGDDRRRGHHSCGASRNTCGDDRQRTAAATASSGSGPASPTSPPTSAVRPARPTRRCRPSRSATSTRKAGRSRSGRRTIDGAEIAVKFINEQAGGIGGHPLELVKCYIASTEEEGQQCGQQFANDESIVAVVDSAPSLVGAESLYAALAGPSRSSPACRSMPSTSPAERSRPVSAAPSTSWRRTPRSPATR